MSLRECFVAHREMLERFTLEEWKGEFRPSIGYGFLECLKLQAWCLFLHFLREQRRQHGVLRIALLGRDRLDAGVESRSDCRVT